MSTNTHVATDYNAAAFASIEQASNAFPTLGWSVMWWMNGVTATHEELVSTMTGCALADFIPKAPSPRVALHRALEAMIRDGAAPPDEEQGDSDQRRSLIRTVNDYSREWLVFALVDEAANLGNLSLRYATKFRIKLHKKTGSMVCVTSATGNIEAENESQQLAAALAPYWEQYKSLHTSRDISMVIKSIIDWAAAVAIRREGGVYFVLEAQADVLTNVRLLLGNLGGNGRQPIFLTLGVPDEPRTKRDMARAAHLALTREAEDWLAKANDTLASDAETRKNTVMRRIMEYQNLRLKVEAYGEILDQRQQELRGNLRAGQELAQKLAHQLALA